MKNDARDLTGRDFRAEELAHNVRGIIKANIPDDVDEGEGTWPAAFRAMAREEHRLGAFVVEINLLLDHLLPRETD